MKKIKFINTVLIVLITFISCDPVNENGSDSNFSNNFGTIVTRDFIGQVVDVNNNPIQSATIKIGSCSVLTDSNGIFIINQASVYQKFAFITATKAGYINGSRSMVPTSGKNNVKIMLLQNIPLQNIPSGTTSEVSLISGTKVVFDGAFMDENGVAYSGVVSVSMYHLMPSDANVNTLMPGMLFAQDENGQDKVLDTYGMLNVELHGSNGQKLQIATGHNAQLNMKIDNSQLTTSPNTIPLWHFDEVKGYWKQEGTATKIGNYYVGNVSHFSWWNCDISNSSILLTISLTNNNGNPLNNLSVELLNSNNQHAVGYTDNNGELSGILPANQIFTVNIRNNCGYIIYTSTIGPYITNAIVPTISINVISNTIIGNLLKCDHSFVSNGYVILKSNGNYFFASVSNGYFGFNYLPSCIGYNSSFTLEGIDFENLQTSGIINYSFSSPIINVGDIMTCNSISEFITYQIDNEPINYLLSNLNGTINSQLNIGGSYGLPYGSGFHINGNTVIPGTYNTDQFSIQATDFSIGNFSTNNTVLFHLNSVGNVGQYIDMTFNGTYLDTISNVPITRNINGIAHVIRNQ